jgi:hypothetical protein
MGKNPGINAFMMSGIGALVLSAAAVGAMTFSIQEAVADEPMTTTATVDSVELENRLIALKSSDGNAFTVHVAEEVASLPDVKAGDKLTLGYYDAVAVDVAKPTQGASPGMTETVDVTTIKEGQLPAGAASVVLKVTSDVVGISHTRDKIVFLGPGNTVRAVSVKSPEDQQLLNELKVGDMVTVTFAEAEAVSLAPAQ